LFYRHRSCFQKNDAGIITARPTRATYWPSLSFPPLPRLLEIHLGDFPLSLCGGPHILVIHHRQPIHGGVKSFDAETFFEINFCVTES
jgi:hypothetical protein